MIFFTFVRVITHLLIPSITDIVVEEKGVVKRRTTLNLEKVEDRIFFQTLNNVPVDCKTLHLEFIIGKGTNKEKKYFAKRNLQMTIITLKACEDIAPLITTTVHYRSFEVCLPKYLDGASLDSIKSVTSILFL